MLLLQAMIHQCCEKSSDYRALQQDVVLATLSKP